MSQEGQINLLYSSEPFKLNNLTFQNIFLVRSFNCNSYVLLIRLYGVIKHLTIHISDGTVPFVQSDSRLFYYSQDYINKWYNPTSSKLGIPKRVVWFDYHCKPVFVYCKISARHCFSSCTSYCIPIQMYYRVNIPQE